jgi:hyperosmotically inducible periplasmic protein
MKQNKFRTIVLTIAAIVLMSGAALGAEPTAENDRTNDDIRRALLRLPYYGVFDFLAFTYDKGTVTLSGYAYRGSLKSDAVKAVQRVSRVDQVIDQIELLPVSQNDDRIRWSTFYRIYNDAFLSRYAPGGGLSFRSDRHFFGSRFPGSEPFGYYPIHIVVKRGQTTLLGVVDNESDRRVAGFRAREVPLTFGVENELLVAKR